MLLSGKLQRCEFKRILRTLLRLGLPNRFTRLQQFCAIFQSSNAGRKQHMRKFSSALVLALVFVTTASAQNSSSPSSSSPSSSSSSSSGSTDRGKTDVAPQAGVNGPAGAPAKPSASYKFYVNGAATIPATPPPTPEQRKADEESRAAWRARCRPTIVEDRDGMRRTQYAADDCDLSRFNTAGEQ